MHTAAEGFRDAVAVVTGGARGIGRACALRLAELGARVAVVDRDLAAAAEYGESLTASSVAEELIARAGAGLALQADLASPEQAADAVHAASAEWGRVDLLVTTAGGAITPYDRSRASLVPDEDLTALLDANVRTAVNCCRAAVPLMRSAGGGAIVTVASGTALSVRAGGYLAGYGSAKAAIVQYTRYLAAEVGPDGIRVNCVAPGVIRTARVVAQSSRTGIVSDEAAATIPLGRQGEASDVADAVEFLLSPMASYVTGQTLAVNGGAVMH